MAKVLLNINGEDQNVKIEKMKVKQLKKALKKIQEIINLVENEESTSELISYFLEMDVKPGNEGAAIDDALEDKIFIENLLGAFKILFNRIPDEITELLSIVSGIEEEVLDEQDYDALFDIVQAVIEENDIKAMIERAKQTFFMARSKWGGFKVVK